MSVQKLRDIPGFNGRYAVTENGNIKSITKTTEKWLKPFFTGSSTKKYLTVELFGKPFFVHRLVGMTFIPNPNNLPEINHKDGNKTNNSIDNLEWTTHLKNVQHAHRTGLIIHKYGEEHAGHKLSTLQVEEIRTKKSKGITLKELSIEYRSCISNISYICRKETRIYG